MFLSRRGTSCRIGSASKTPAWSMIVNLPSNAPVRWAKVKVGDHVSFAGTWLGVAVSQVMLMATPFSGYLSFVYIDLLGATAVGAIPVGAWLGLYWPEIMGRLEQARSS